jgi:hypothetical protein
MVRDDLTSTVPKGEIAHFQCFCSSWCLGEDHFARSRCKEETSNDDVHSVVEDTSSHRV